MRASPWLHAVCMMETRLQAGRALSGEVAERLKAPAC